MRSMLHMKTLRLLGALLLAAVFTTTIEMSAVSPAQAALPAGAPTTRNASAPKTSTEVYNVGCWTTIKNGRQYYANCDRKSGAWVCPGYILNGVKHRIRLVINPGNQEVDLSQWVDGYDGLADDHDTAVWYLIPIPSGAARTTVFC
jgi:hypothetical protein